MMKKFKNILKEYKLYIIMPIVCILIYSIILGFFGIFGIFVQNILLYFVINILPIIAICFGYFMTIFIPIRVIQAINRNNELKADYEQDKKLQEHANRSKLLKENILKAMGDKGTF